MTRLRASAQDKPSELAQGKLRQPIEITLRPQVMVLEDDAILSLDLEQGLRAMGCDVVGPFARADAAMASLAQRKPDAALLDLKLRGSSSLEVGRELIRQTIPFAILTVSDPRDIPEDFAGQRVYQKPFRTADLPDLITYLGLSPSTG